MATTANTGPNTYSTEIISDNHTFWADEPVEAGGQDKGPSPMQYLEAAIASCSTITIRMYADRKGWDLKGVKVTVERTQDAENRETIMAKKIELTGDLDEKQIKRLIDIGGRCPVVKLVSDNLKIVNKD